MVQIEINNSESRIVGLGEEELRRIRNILRYPNPDWNPNFRKGIRSWQYLYLLDIRSGLFPTGLLSYVTRFLDCQHLSYTYVDLRLRPTGFHIYKVNKALPDPRPYQNAVLALVPEKERGTICLPTGLGKTLLAILMIIKLGQRCIFVVPSLTLVKQTYEIMVAFFGKRIVGTSGTDKMIVIANYQSLVKQEKEYFDQFGLLILDESHHASANTLYDLSLKKMEGIYYRYFLTATPYRNDGSDMKLYAVIGDNIFYYPIAQAVRDGWIAYPFFMFYNVWNTDKSPEPDFMFEYKSHIVENKSRNLMIAGITRKLILAKRQILILVKEIAHGEELSRLIPGSLFIKGEQDKKLINENFTIMNLFRERKFSVLIATSVIGEGTDINSIDTVINAAGMKARSQLIQKIGRGLRILNDKTYAMYIDFIDKNTSYLENHSMERLKSCEEYETQIKVMDYET